MLQFYLRRERLLLSWVGSGRLIFSHNFTEPEFDEVVCRFVAAAQAMQAEGWWWRGPAASNKAIRRRVLREALARRLGLA
jgi:glutamate-1-semialdehyde 2,1-aminomutase